MTLLKSLQVLISVSLCFISGPPKFFWQVPPLERMDQFKELMDQSLEMLKVRASLMEKLKQKGLYSHTAPKPRNFLKRLRPANGQLETYDDFDDEVVDDKVPARLSSKVSQFLNANLKKPKVVSGDDDLPKRDNTGERRKKHEDPGDYYKQVEKLRAAKLAAKAKTYSRKSAAPSLPEETLEGKRHITSQMEKNRGLTRRRNKDKKNPRKNYKVKHQKAIKKRKGQVQSIKKPTGTYGGESTGINATISRSIKLIGSLRLKK